MNMDTHLTIIIPAAHAELARKVCAALWGEQGMFTAGLGATKDSAPTHWVSSGYMPESLAKVFATKDAATLTKALGSAVPAASVQAMLDAAVVGEADTALLLIGGLNVKALDETAAKTAAVTEASKATYDLKSVPPLTKEAAPVKDAEPIKTETKK